MRILAVINGNTGHQIVCLCLDWWLCLCCCIVGEGGIVVSRGWTAAFLQHSSGKHDNKDRHKDSTFIPTSVSVAALWVFVCVCVSFSVSQCVADDEKMEMRFSCLQMAENIQNELSQSSELLMLQRTSAVKVWWSKFPFQLAVAHLTFTPFQIWWTGNHKKMVADCLEGMRVWRLRWKELIRSENRQKLGKKLLQLRVNDSMLSCEKLSTPTLVL